LGRHRRRETAPTLAKNTSVAMQQRPGTERARHLSSAHRGVDFGSAKARLYDGGKRVPATFSAIADAVRLAEQIMEEIDRRHL